MRALFSAEEYKLGRGGRNWDERVPVRRRGRREGGRRPAQLVEKTCRQHWPAKRREPRAKMELTHRASHGLQPLVEGGNCEACCAHSLQLTLQVRYIGGAVGEQAVWGGGGQLARAALLVALARRSMARAAAREGSAGSRPCARCRRPWLLPLPQRVLGAVGVLRPRRQHLCLRAHSRG